MRFRKFIMQDIISSSEKLYNAAYIYIVQDGETVQVYVKIDSINNDDNNNDRENLLVYNSAKRR